MKNCMYITLTGIIFVCFILYLTTDKYITSDKLYEGVITVQQVNSHLYIRNNEHNLMGSNDIMCDSLNSLNNSKVISNDVNSNIDESKEKIEAKVSEQAREKKQTEDEINKEEKKTKLNKVIVIDPGHASRTSAEKEPIAPGSNIMKVKESGGAQGTLTNTPEYIINMQVAFKLKKELEKIGYTVIMTKDKNKVMLGNIQRAEVGNKANADLVIRIHADSNGSSSPNGASMLVPANTKYTKSIYEHSKKYGGIILNSVVNNVGMKNRGVVERDDLTGFNWSKVPVVLIEMGFQSNPKEDGLLCTDQYQNKITKGVIEGINKIFK